MRSVKCCAARFGRRPTSAGTYCCDAHADCDADCDADVRSCAQACSG